MRQDSVFFGGKPSTLTRHDSGRCSIKGMMPLWLLSTCCACLLPFVSLEVPFAVLEPLLKLAAKHDEAWQLDVQIGTVVVCRLV